MKKSKLHFYLNHFNNWEISHFKKFLCSPFFNRRNDLIKLLDYFTTEKGKTSPDFSKTSAFAAIFPNEPFDDYKMYLLMSRLSKQVEQFLAHREVSEDKVLLQLHVARAFRRIRMEDSFKKAISDGQQMLDKQPLRDWNYLRRLYDLELEHYDYLGSISRSLENNLQKLCDAFDHMYIAEKLRQFCMQVSHQAVFEKDYAVAMQQTILSLLENVPSYREHPAINIYYLCYQAVTTGEETFFKQLRAQMQLHLDCFAATELRGIYFMAINYCIRRMNTGQPQYIREGFELYRDGLEGGYLMEQGEVSRFTFNNVVLLGMKLNKYEWVEQFIENYRSMLAQPFRRSVYSYSLAQLRYEQKRYADAMRLLLNFDSNDHLMNLGAKLILLKIYYETNEHTALDSLLESMRVYLQRKKVMSYHKEYYSLIIRLTKKLVGLSGNQKDKAVLQEKAMELQVASMREWFLKQIG